MNADTHTVETYHDEREWLQARLNGIAASEASAVVRRSTRCAPYGLYVRKIEGRVEDDDDTNDGDEMAEWGHRLEQPIAEKFCEVTGFTVKDPGDYTIFRSVERPWVTCTLDRLVYGPMGLLEGVLELKCAYFEQAKVWREIVPISHLIQIQIQMYVVGVAQGWVAVLCNGHHWQYHPVERDQELIDRLLPRLDAFWQRVQDRDPPPIDGSKSTTEALRHVHGDGDPEKAIDLDWEYAALAEQLEAADAVATKAQAEVDTIKNKFRDALGDATVGLLPSGGKVTWKTDARGVRSLRTKQPKQKAKSA